MLNATLDNNIAALLAHELDPAFAARAALILRHLQPASAGRISTWAAVAGSTPEQLPHSIPRQPWSASTTATTISLQPQSTHRARPCRSRVQTLNLSPLRQASSMRLYAPKSLEHIVDDGAVLMELNRVLRDGGSLLISVPNRQYPFMWDPLNWMLERVFVRTCRHTSGGLPASGRITCASIRPQS